MQAKEANDRTTNRLSYEDQLYIWCLLLQTNLVGKVKGRHKTEYIMLVPDGRAVAEINALSDTTITTKHLPSILKRFKHLDPPYSSFPPDRKAYKREWMQRRRWEQKWGARIDAIEQPKSVHTVP